MAKLGFPMTWINWVMIQKKNMARFARNIVEDLYWMEDEPPPAVDALHHDHLHINE